MVENFVVGKSINNRDAFELVTGKAKYCTEIELPGMLHGKILRSTKAHARILNIDTSRAEKLLGVKCVITGKDVPVKRYGEVICDKHLLAHDIVRFVGDPLAAVSAETIDSANEALDLIKVEYEELPTVFDPEEAWVTDPRVVLHPELFNYELGPISAAPDQRVVFIPDRPNVCKHYKVRHGDIEKGFKEADEIVENRFSTARIQACTMEPHGCIAHVDADGRVTIYSGRQLLFFSRKYLCGALNLPASKVRLISSMRIGGSFGSKSIFAVEPIAAILAQKSGRPVKIILSREEVFENGGSRIPMVIYLRDGVKRDGTIVAREAKVILNAGAYAVLAPVMATNLTYALAGTYRIPNMNVDSYAVYTNGPESISFRGFASSQPIWAVESQMDILAEKLGISAVDIRRKNILNEGEENIHGEYMHSIGAKQCLEKVVEEMGRSKKTGSVPDNCRVGWGLAMGSKYCMPGVTSLGWVKVHEDGTLEVRHSADNFGQGINTIIPQIAADVFKMSVNRVRVSYGDTDNVPFSTGTIAQSSTYNIGKTVLLASLDARNQVLERAAWRLGVPVEVLETKDGVVYVKADLSKAIDIADLFRHTASGGYVEEVGEILGKALWVQPGAPPDPETGQIDPALAKKGLRRSPFYGHAAQAAEVMVNMDTGQVEVTRLILACDMGYPINPKLCEGQMYGGLAMSLGSALMEQMVMANGKVINSNLHDYKIPAVCSIPDRENIKILFAPASHKEGPYGAKGMGETVMTPGAPAIGNAIYNAIGIRIKDLPITQEKIVNLIKQN